MSMLKGAGRGEYKLSQQQQQQQQDTCRFMNSDGSQFGLNNDNNDIDKEIKILNSNDNNISNNGEIFYKKHPNQENMNKIFENWKFANSMFNFNFLKGNNNNNNNNLNMKNLNTNSLITNSSTNKLGKTLKPHICTICQKRFAR